MNTGNNANRWWEGYLVRYLMPSIAGMVIVSNLSNISGPEMRSVLFIPSEVRDLDAARLILLFLYGNLFCYIASYPILTFHATRVIDFGKEGNKWPAKIHLDGYLATFFAGALVIVLSTLYSDLLAVISAFAVAVGFSSLQIARMYTAFTNKIECWGLKNKVTPLYGLAYSLSRRRGIITENQKNWTNKELVDTYRHLREHGNTAFIFFLELILAGLCFLIISNTSSSHHLLLLGILFGIWAIPSVLIHLVGQHLERRFSLYDRRLTAGSDEEIREEEAEGSL
ncbi:hypothetical protein KI809_04975 [Geobacter pelophilus]|uniref:Uncharacterized protein n=1 Tax=Geoanaerobacter pelophilus TaxID=60036 RepID=A0AAW4L2C3_9BACT|nr:hypothetical protein [Geoanaerobacter pelophilus]MBT0663650.1 hypothetical protein [Geoanaerobacter pelophilus]